VPQSLFTCSKAERQRELLETGCRQHWDKRRYMFRAGSPVGAVFKVTSGVVAESRMLSDGRRHHRLLPAGRHLRLP